MTGLSSVVWLLSPEVSLVPLPESVEFTSESPVEIFSTLESLFSMKPILMASEIDDSRPTVIREFHKNPTFISVLSGKINTVYDLDEVLKNGK